MNTAFIQAKGTNVRLPDKHLEFIGPKRLIEHVIDNARDSETIDNVYLFTDDARLMEIARESRIGVIEEPEELTRVKSEGPLIEYRMDAWRSIHGEPSREDVFVERYGNVILFDEGLIDRAVQIFSGMSSGHVESMYKIEGMPYPYDWRRLRIDGSVEFPNTKSDDVRVRTEDPQKDFQGLYDDGGVRVHGWPFQTHPIYPVITARCDALEIDTLTDLNLSRAVYEAKSSGSWQNLREYQGVLA